MNALPPIPTPPAKRWREFRLQAAPVLVFLGAAAATVVLWRTSLSGTTLVGQVEPVSAVVSSTHAGVLAQLNVSRFQAVRRGEPIAQVIITDPQVLTTSLAVIRADIEMLRASMFPIVDRQRVAIDYDRLKLDWMSQRAQLAMAKVNLQLAEAELERTQELYRENIVAERVLEQARANQESLRAQVEELSRLVQEQESHFERLAPDGQTDPSRVSADPLHAALAAQEARLRQTEAQLSPITLRVPIDGVVSMIYRRSGETVVAGEPILAISSPHSDRIVSYLRQPFPFEPRVGQPVEIRTRHLPKKVTVGHILQVGKQMDVIPPALLPPLRSAQAELGLPMLISLPSELNTIPGEVVDLRVKPVAP